MGWNFRQTEIYAETWFSDNAHKSGNNEEHKIRWG